MNRVIGRLLISKETSVVFCLSSTYFIVHTVLNFISHQGSLLNQKFLVLTKGSNTNTVQPNPGAHGYGSYQGSFTPINNSI